MDQIELIKNKERLYKCLLEKDSMQRIVNIAYEILGNPVVIVDRGFKVLTCTVIKLNNEFWDNIISEKGYFDSVFAISVKSSKEIQKCLMYKTPSICIMPNLPRNYITGIFIDNQCVASFGLLEICKNFGENEIEILSFMSEILSIEMQKGKYNYNNKVLMHECFLNDLLEERIYDDNEINNRILYSDLNFKKFNYVFIIDMSTNKKSNLNNVRIINDLSFILHDSYSFSYHSYVVTLISADSKYLINDSTFKDLERFLTKRNLCGGLSLCFSHIKDFKTYFTQSKKAIQLSQHLNDNKIICKYEEYAYHHLLEISSRASDIMSICHPSIFTIMDYDKKNETELLKSLFFYIKYDKSITSAATTLHVHRNTLHSRITKIKSIIDIDWENNEVMKYLYLSLKILEYANHFSFEGK